MTKKFLNRDEAATYLTNLGLPVRKTTLSKWATVGGGPQYQLFGNRALYTVENLDAWANKRLTTPRSSTTCAA